MRRGDWCRTKFGSLFVLCGTGLLLLSIPEAASALPSATESFWAWLTYQESGSATLRNMGLLVLALIGLPFAMWRTVVAARQAAIAQRTQRNERHQKAVEMLGKNVLAVRLGGIYALQNLAEEDPTRYHIQIMRLFCAFLQDPTPIHDPRTRPGGSKATTDESNKSNEARIRRDVQDVVRAIGNRGSKEIEIEETAGFELVIRGADLCALRMHDVVSSTYTFNPNSKKKAMKLVDRRPRRRANLSRIHVRNVNLADADLSYTDMSDAVFWDPNLTNAVLDAMNLSRTRWEGGSLTGARLSSADLSGASILETSLAAVNLSSANLSGVVFQEVDLSDANLRGAILSGTHFSLIKYKNALIVREGVGPFIPKTGDNCVGVRGLTQQQIDEACADPKNPPQIEGVVDARTGEPLVWRGKPVLA